MAEEVKNTNTESTATDSGTSTNSRVDEINKMYDANIASKTSALESQRDTALSEAQANKDKLADTYNEKRNSIASEYERQRRNNNLQANANGLNTGAASQMQLGQMNAYQNTSTELNKAQADQESEADRNMATIRQEYSSQIQQAAADNDFARMSALYEEGVRQEEQARNDAGVMASFGDFSGYVNIYGQEVANQMAKTWAYQNPDLAYTMGKISADEYYKLTGKYPNGYSAPSSGGGWYGYDTSSNGDLTKVVGSANLDNENYATVLSDGTLGTITSEKPSRSKEDNISTTIYATTPSQIERAYNNSSSAQQKVASQTTIIPASSNSSTNARLNGVYSTVSSSNKSTRKR